MSDALTAHTVDHATCTATVLDQGALVLAWAPRGADPVLFARPGTPVVHGKSPHAGIPVCWPWFGPGRGPGPLPAHGIVRAAEWHLVDREDTADAVTLQHRITSDMATSEHFPHRYVLDLRTHLGEVLELSLTTTNTGADPFEVEEALHTYLHVGDVRQVHLEGLDGAAYRDKTTGRDERQRGDVTFTGETDRAYVSADRVTVVDPVLGRRLRVGTDGAANRVVWNPWADEAAKLADVGDSWPSFVCVEGGNVLDLAVTVEPGGRHTMTYRVEVL